MCVRVCVRACVCVCVRGRGGGGGSVEVRGRDGLTGYIMATLTN